MLLAVSSIGVGIGTGLFVGVFEGEVDVTGEGDEVAVLVWVGIGDDDDVGLGPSITKIARKKIIATIAVAMPFGVDVRSIAVFLVSDSDQIVKGQDVHLFIIA